MIDNELKPSKALCEEYKQSETTKRLNAFPCYEYLKEKIDMKYEVYEKLKDRYKEELKVKNNWYYKIKKINPNFIKNNILWFNNTTLIKILII